jgi:hypothetical protein
LEEIAEAVTKEHSVEGSLNKGADNEKEKGRRFMGFSQWVSSEKLNRVGG